MKNAREEKQQRRLFRDVESKAKTSLSTYQNKVRTHLRTLLLNPMSIISKVYYH